MKTTESYDEILKDVNQKGWICPSCGRGNAPWSPSCPCIPWPNEEQNTEEMEE